MGEAVVEDIQHRDKFAGCLEVAGTAGVVIPAGILEHIGRRIVVPIGLMLDGILPQTMMVSAGSTQIIEIGTAAVGGQDIVEIEHSKILQWIVPKPFLNQPVIESTCVGGIG